MIAGRSMSVHAVDVLPWIDLNTLYSIIIAIFLAFFVFSHPRNTRQRIAEDAKLRLLLKSIGGLPMADLTEEQKEVAAKAIECGFLRKVGDVLEPRIVAIEKKDWDDFGKLLQGYYDSLDELCRQIAEELHGYIRTHIQKHLLSEWKFYNQLIAGSHVINALIEKCIAADMLTVPENRLGPEGVLLVVEK